MADASRSEIGVAHLGMRLDLRGGAFRQQLALMHHRNDVADRLDETHVVLDHDQRVPALEPVEQLGGLAGLLRGHAGGRLVHQDQLGVLREQHPDLEPLGLAVREIGRRLLELFGKADELGEASRCPSRPARRTSQRRLAHTPGLPRSRDLEILAHREIAEHARHLELAADAGARDLVLLQCHRASRRRR